jgi:hypothetical protein
MTINKLLSQLRKLGFQLWLEDGQLYYKAPKNTLNAELLTLLKERKNEIIEFLQNTQKSTQLPTLQALPRESHQFNFFPLSLTQSARFHIYLLAEQEQQSFQASSLNKYAHLGPGYSKFGSFEAVRLEGELDVNALEKGLNTIVERHESLRATFTLSNGHPIQKVSSTLSIDLPVLDLCHLSKAEQEVEAKSLAIQEDKTPFSLEKDPLLRAALLKLSKTEHILFLNIHHIVIDAHSFEILIRELELLYEAFASGFFHPELPTLPIQYCDFAYWQRHYLQGEAMETLNSYWRRQFAGLQSPLEFPTDYPRSEQFSFQAVKQFVRFPAHLVKNIKSVGTQLGVTVFTILLSALQIALFSYSRNPEVLVTIPMLGRKLYETNNLIGLFSNGVVLRTNLASNLTLVDLLSRVQSTILGALAHQDLPYLKQMEVLLGERELWCIPLLPVSFNYVQAKIWTSSFSGLAVKPFEFTPEPRAGNDLSLFLRDTQEGDICGSFVFNGKLFSPVTIQKMLDRFQYTLISIVNNAEIRLSDLI